MSDRLDFNYVTLTAAAEAELVPQVPVPSLPAGTILRARLAGKASKQEGPATARLSVAVSPTPWVRGGSIVLTTNDMTLTEAECIDVPWILTFEIHVRESRDMGSTLHRWHTPVVATGKYEGGNVVSPILLPIEAPYEVIVDTSEPNVLHVLYEPELDTMSITCMTYVLEVL